MLFNNKKRARMCRAPDNSGKSYFYVAKSLSHPLSLCACATEKCAAHGFLSVLFVFIQLDFLFR